MDIFPYLIDVLLTVVAAYWFVINTRRRSGSPTTGLFRYHETLNPPEAEAFKIQRPAHYRPQPTGVAAAYAARARR